MPQKRDRLFLLISSKRESYLKKKKSTEKQINSSSKLTSQKLAI